MSKIFLEKAIFVNRAPFERLELDFKENEIAVLSAVNGKGKTTILSHIMDAFYEMIKYAVRDYAKSKEEYYRVSTPMFNLNINKPSWVYFRFKINNKQIDYLDWNLKFTEEEYNNQITIKNKIPYANLKSILDLTPNHKMFFPDLDLKEIATLFNENILIYFPSYRSELPNYLNEQYKIKSEFTKSDHINFFLKNPIEVNPKLSLIANWILDLVLDYREKWDLDSRTKFDIISNILTQTVIAKDYGKLRFGIGPRNLGATRIQIVKVDDPSYLVYPSIFNMSSGELSLLCLFIEILRQSDNLNVNLKLNEITGIVLIDEIDKHLHIKLQKEVLPTLLNMFPNIQFIVSSHSPFLGLGLKKQANARSKNIDLDLGITTDFNNCSVFDEAYNTFITENNNFKQELEKLKLEITNNTQLQILTEGNNIKHIKKAITILEPNLLSQINFPKPENSGKTNLKTAFEVIKNANFQNKFLFVWDCDAKLEIDPISDSDKVKKFCFDENIANDVTIDKNGKRIGIENLYPINLIEEFIIIKEEPGNFKRNNTHPHLDKTKFIDKIEKETDPKIFEKFQPLINIIKELVK